MSKKQAIKAISLLWLGSVLGAGCAFMTQVILARQLGPTDFGIFAAALATVTLLAPIAGFGVSQYWLKSFGQEGWGAMRWLPASFRFVAASTALVLVVLAAWSLFGPHDAFTGIIIASLSLYVLGQVVVELVSGKLQLEQRYAYLALWQLLPHLARFVLVVSLVFLFSKWMNLQNVAFAYSAIAIIFAVLGAGQLLRMSMGFFDLKGHSLRDSTSQIARPDMISVLSHAWPFGLSGLFCLIYFQSDIILVKYIIGPEEAGIYNVAFTVMAAVYMLPNVIYQKFLLPKMHRWANQDPRRFYEVYRQGNIAMLLLGVVAMLAIWASSSLAIPFLFGQKFKNAIVLLNILAICAPIIFVASSVGAALVTREHMRRKIWYMGIVALVNLALNFILIPAYAAYGAAVATLVSGITLLVLYLIAVRRHVFGAEAWRG